MTMGGIEDVSDVRMPRSSSRRRKCPGVRQSMIRFIELWDAAVADWERRTAVAAR